MVAAYRSRRDDVAKFCECGNRLSSAEAVPSSSIWLDISAFRTLGAASSPSSDDTRQNAVVAPPGSARQAMTTFEFTRGRADSTARGVPADRVPSPAALEPMKFLGELERRSRAGRGPRIRQMYDASSVTSDYVPTATEHHDPPTITPPKRDSKRQRSPSCSLSTGTEVEFRDMVLVLRGSSRSDYEVELRGRHRYPG
jgi:hypothetical protein